MNFAMICDTVGSHMKSFYIKDNKGYDFDGNPFDFNFSIGNDFYVSIWNYPKLYENGHFIKWQDWGDDLPDLDLDLIFLSIEKLLLNPDYTVDKIRKKYPNAKIAGWIKELWVGEPYNYTHPKHKARIKFLNECDVVVTNRNTEDGFREIAGGVNKSFNFVSIPVDTDYLYNNFYGDKELSIWAYLPNPMDRRSNTYEFSKYIGEKYNIPVRFKPLQPNQKFDYMSQKEFITNWSSCAFHFNLDPIDYFPGNQCALVAGTGTIHIGGVNDYHHILFPETATCDTTILETRVEEYINDSYKYIDTMSKAMKKLEEVFSFDAVRKQIENIKE